MKLTKFCRSAIASVVLAGGALSASAGLVFDLNVPTGLVYGQVILDDTDSGVVHVTVDLASGYNFVDTGNHYAFGFNIAGDAFTVTNISPTSSYQNLTSPASDTQPGFGTFNGLIACPTACQGGNNSAVPNDLLTFDVNLSGITASSFVANAAGFYFSADLFGKLPGGTTPATFAVGANEPGDPWTPPPIPEPSTYALMLAGLGAMGLVARRRSRKQ